MNIHNLSQTNGYLMYGTHGAGANDEIQEKQQQPQRTYIKKTFKSRNLKVINMIAIHSRVW